jgi:hypothetical protein
MLRSALVFACVGLLPCVALARNCQYEKGEERWQVKTSVESVAAIPNARAVDLASLIALDNPPMTKEEIKAIEKTLWTGSVKVKDASGNEIELHEGDIVTVTGYVYRARCQRDGDFHMEIGAGATRKSQCLIVEVPDPKQIPDAQLRELVSGARDPLAQMDPSVYQSKPKKKPIKATITGQLFLDAPHYRKTDPSGGRGTLLASRRHCASNLWEIHPVVRIE